MTHINEKNNCESTFSEQENQVLISHHVGGKTKIENLHFRSEKGRSNMNFDFHLKNFMIELPWKKILNLYFCTEIK